MADIQLLRHDMDWAMQAIRTHRAVLIIDLAGRIVAANQLCLRLCGYRRDELLGRSVVILLDPSEKAPTRLGSLLDVGDGQEHRIDGMCQISKAGRRYRVDARICPIRDDQGEVRLNVLFLRESVEEDGPLHAIAPHVLGERGQVVELPDHLLEAQPQKWASPAGYGRTYARCGEP